MNRIPMTEDGYAKLQNELNNLVNKKRPKIIEAIAEARSHGDLSENAEYQYAKEQQSLIEGKIQELESAIALAEIIDVSTLSGKEILFGATVEIKMMGLETFQHIKLLENMSLILKIKNFQLVVRSQKD